jgi:outer membrane protein assembly factor BamB
LKWEDKTITPGALVAADGKLIILTGKGELIVANATPEKFDIISRAPVLTGKCWSSPVLANGRIYCRNSTGDVVCLDVKGK